MSELPKREPRKRLTREESRAQTRARLLESAQALFALKGFEGVSVDEIARDAGYTRGAFYGNFTDKLAIMRELIAHGFDGDLEQISQMHVSPGVRAFEALAEAYASDPTNTLWSLEFQLAAVRHPELREDYARQFDRLRSAVSGVVAKEFERQELSDPEMASRFADVFIAILSGLSLVRILDPEKVPAGTFTEVYEALVVGIPGISGRVG